MFRLSTGVVKFFDSRDNKRYGFIILEDGREVFFHYNDGSILEPDEWGTSQWYMPNQSSGTVLDYPKVGDRLYFHLAAAYPGPKARPWTSEAYYKKAVEHETCPCGHFLDPDHESGRCEKCQCPDFGLPTEAWETFKEVNVGDGPGGFKIYE